MTRSISLKIIIFCALLIFLFISQRSNPSSRAATRASEPLWTGVSSYGQTRPATALPSDFPAITVTVPASGTADGFIFLSALRWPPINTQVTYLLILDNNGQPIYYNRVVASIPALLGYDFKAQPKGTLTYFDRIQEKHIELNDRYEVINIWQPKNGFVDDHHDFQLLPGGRNFVLARDERRMNMATLVPGGQRNALVQGFVVQEQNDNHDLVFQWDSWDHFNIKDATHTPLTDTLIDYVHGNSVDLDTDGNLIISNRNLDEITKINYATGQIMWRLGGKHNQFKFVNDPRGFSWQHDVHRLPNGHLTLFDNGVYHTPQYSRGVEYELDETNKVITMVQEFRNTPDVYGDAMGNVQRLPNGNTFIGWGDTNPTATEYRPDGSKAFEFTLPPDTVSYRVLRLPWRARPATPPLLDLEAITSTARLSFSWNGATHVQTYHIYEGSAPGPTNVIQTAMRTGFASTATIEGLTRGMHYFRVKAVDDQGVESDYSNEVNAMLTDAPLFLPIVIR